jgi:ElaB/YqjD/DUF883 family membrane-anchored ribosome-binding protein
MTYVPALALRVLCDHHAAELAACRGESARAEQLAAELRALRLWVDRVLGSSKFAAVEAAATERRRIVAMLRHLADTGSRKDAGFLRRVANLIEENL